MGGEAAEPHGRPDVLNGGSPVHQASPQRMLLPLLLLALAALPAAGHASTGKQPGAYIHPAPAGVEVGDIVFGHSSGIVEA
jgi:hypothetical protein